VLLLEVQILIAAALIFMPLEQLVPLHAGKATLRPGLGVDLLHLVVSGFLIRVGMAGAGLALTYACGLLIPAAVHAAIRNQPGWLQFVELLLLADFCFYVAHRLVHVVPWLWRFHAVHHSSEQMDWLATFRVHPVDQVLNSTIIALPGIALGFSPGALLAYALLYRGHSLLLHSNVGLRFGRLGQIIASPHYHHWHHADDPRAHERNFGGQLVIWDALFGTLHKPATLPERYGTQDGPPCGSYVQQLLAPMLPRRRRRRARRDVVPGSVAMEQR
jgi:sterol desaturase/sphingolipid hydroxylase (fatty acid hydroxylase superfamily)